MASQWFYHHSLFDTHNSFSGLDSTVHNQSNGPLHAPSALFPLSSSHFPVILDRKTSQKVGILTMYFFTFFFKSSLNRLLPSQEWTAPVKVNHNLNVAKPTGYVLVLISCNVTAALYSISPFPSGITFFPWLLRYHTLFFFLLSLLTPSQTSLQFLQVIGFGAIKVRLQVKLL